MYYAIFIMFFLPTALSIILLCVRGKGRRIVPLLSIIFNITIYGIMNSGSENQGPVFRLPFEYTNYPYVCMAVLISGLIFEMVVRATGRWWRPLIDESDVPTKNSGITMADIFVFVVVLISPIIIFDKQLFSTVIYTLFIIFAASQLKGLKIPWIMGAFWLYGCLQLVYLAISLGYSPAFRALTGFEYSNSTFRTFMFWSGWYALIVHIIFGAAFYMLCKKFKDQIKPSEELSKGSAISADETSALPGDQLAEPPRLCADKAPTLIDIDVNSQS